ncbi:MAG: hypothetical protein ACK5TR_08545 [Alphaproteobacteria bacterium]|nr:hypothetical protein [Alphaproteobacteria bacterium]
MIFQNYSSYLNAPIHVINYLEEAEKSYPYNRMSEASLLLESRALDRRTNPKKYPAIYALENSDLNIGYDGDTLTLTQLDLITSQSPLLYTAPTFEHLKTLMDETPPSQCLRIIDASCSAVGIYSETPLTLCILYGIRTSNHLFLSGKVHLPEDSHFLSANTLWLIHWSSKVRIMHHRVSQHFVNPPKNTPKPDDVPQKLWDIFFSA